MNPYIETLYRKRNPEATAWREQFFELSMGKQTVRGKTSYYVRETQCWWDAKGKRMVRVQYTLSPLQGSLTIEEARDRLQVQRMFRVRRGFVHCFIPAYDPARKSRYVLLEVPAEPERPQTAETSDVLSES